jgi:hypothetical protein
LRSTDSPQFYPERFVPKAFIKSVSKLGIVNPGENEPGWPIILVLRLAVTRSDGVKQHSTVVTYDADPWVRLWICYSGRKRPKMPDDELRPFVGVVLNEPYAQRISRVYPSIWKDYVSFRVLAAATGTAEAGRTIASGDEEGAGD